MPYPLIPLLGAARPWRTAVDTIAEREKPHPRKVIAAALRRAVLLAPTGLWGAAVYIGLRRV